MLLFSLHDLGVNPLAQQKRYHGSGNRENISPNMDDRNRQVKSTENVGLVSKVEPLNQ